MLSGLVAPFLARRNVHYGWAMVAITFLTMLATAASMGMPGVLLVPLKQEFGWDTGAISGAMALRLVLYGAMGPFAAALMSRYGLKVTICSALAMIVGGLVLSTRMTLLWQFYVFWGVLVGMGTGMTAIVLGATVANRWFTARRGLVLGLLTSAAATGQLVFLPIAAWLAETYGWRVSVLAPISALSVAFVMMLLFGRDHPCEVGLAPYGEAGPPRPPPQQPAEGAVRTALATLGDAAQHRMFWVLFGTFAICGFTTNGLVQTHFIPLCQDFGMAAVAGASVLALMGMFDFFGAIGSGFLSDRFSSSKLLFWYYFLRGLSLLALPFSNFSLVGLSLFAVFYGLDWIATVPPTVKLAASSFGREQAPLVFGWIFTAHQIGAAIAALGAGITHDMLSTYLPAFFTGGVLCLVAAVTALFARPARLPTVAPAPVQV
ncbi:MAG: MFS transporter [Bordetella sp. SCN 68-11]|nr:MFS transporter [Rhodospirillales bacterium]ODU67152.1 MAG: MFS transporter [Bordetella sp. SCN 68-11]OJY73125.1 MAG: MFS transporter [Rhodospirillales bacterium 70-18]